MKIKMIVVQIQIALIPLQERVNFDFNFDPKNFQSIVFSITIDWREKIKPNFSSFESWSINFVIIYADWTYVYNDRLNMYVVRRLTVILSYHLSHNHFTQLILISAYSRFTPWTGHTCRCKTGFTGIPTDKQVGCQNINECGNGSHDCHEKASCTDLTPSYKWLVSKFIKKKFQISTFEKLNFSKCKPGYTGNGFSCEDVDECSPFYGGNKCTKGANSQCLNTPGSFECVCQDGFVSTSID